MHVLLSLSLSSSNAVSDCFLALGFFLLLYIHLCFFFLSFFAFSCRDDGVFVDKMVCIFVDLFLLFLKGSLNQFLRQVIGLKMVSSADTAAKWESTLPWVRTRRRVMHSERAVHALAIFENSFFVMASLTVEVAPMATVKSDRTAVHALPVDEVHAVFLADV